MSRDILLARRDGCAFVARPADMKESRTAPWPAIREEVIAIPVSEKEHTAAPLVESGSDGLLQAAPRPDLFRDLISQLAAEPGAVHLNPSHEGLRIVMRSASGSEKEIPLPSLDSLGVLAAALGSTPRSIVDLRPGSAGDEVPPRALVTTRPDGPDFRLEVLIASAAGPAPLSLADTGMAPALLDRLLDSIALAQGAILVTGSPGSGRTTILGLLAGIMLARGRRGVMFVSRESGAGAPFPCDPALPTRALAWARIASLPADPFEFAVLDDPAGLDIALVSRLAAAGCVVLASGPPANPHALVRLFDGATGAYPNHVEVLAVDLVRSVCADCTTWRTLSVEEARRHGFHRRDLEGFAQRGGLSVPAGQGCAACAGTGSAGVVGVFEHGATDIGKDPLPGLREDGWAKVIQGLAVAADVARLPGAGRPMRPIQECVSAAQGLPMTRQENDAGAGEGPPIVAEPVERRPLIASSREDGGHGDEDRVAEGIGAIGAPSLGSLEEDRDPARVTATPAMALSDAEVLSGLLVDASAGRGDATALEELIDSLSQRASGNEPVLALLAPSKGFHLTRHMVNTALLAARIGRSFDPPMETGPLVRLGLLHDIGLAAAGIDPSTELPATVSKESIDQSGARMKPATLLRAFGFEDKALEDSVRRVHRSTSQGDPDPAVNVVALASLLEIASRGHTAGRAIDVHDATCVVMERHGRAFDREYFRALLRAVPIHPTGSLVELSNGDFARVVAINDENPFRPRVEIQLAGGGKGMPGRRVVELARAPFLHIRHRVVGTESSGATG